MRRAPRWTGARRVAVGGMAEVWLATGAEGRPVAVKRLLPALSDRPEYLAAFVEEARVLALLDHPNVLRVIDLGMDEEPWLAVEWVDGVDLARAAATLRSRGLAASPGLVALVAQDLLAALEHVHGARDLEGRPLGLVHRDVSPQNLLLGRDGACTLIDFGVAKCAGLEAVTLSGVIKGKTAYLAPEQLEDRPLDHRVDLFAAGVVLYELSCGRHPFLGACEGATMRAISQARPASPSSLRPELPERFSAAVLRALAARPGDRFPDARTFAAEVAAALPPPLAPPQVAALLGELFPRGFPHEEAEEPASRGPAEPLGRLKLLRARVTEGLPWNAAGVPPVELEVAVPRRFHPRAARPLVPRPRPPTRPERPPVLHPRAPPADAPAALAPEGDGGAGVG